MYVESQCVIHIYIISKGWRPCRRPPFLKAPWSVKKSKLTCFEKRERERERKREREREGEREREREREREKQTERDQTATAEHGRERSRALCRNHLFGNGFRSYLEAWGSEIWAQRGPKCFKKGPKMFKKGAQKGSWATLAPMLVPKWWLVRFLVAFGALLGSHLNTQNGQNNEFEWLFLVLLFE